MKRIVLFIAVLFPLLTQAQWTPQTSNTNYSLDEVYFLNADTGFAVGMFSIVKTVDGGNNWQLTTMSNYAIDGIYFTDDNTGFAVGFNLATNKTIIIRTTNGGTTWVPTDLASSWNAFNIHFCDARNGCIVGEQGNALRTVDGGATWTPMTTNSSAFLQDVFFTDSLHGIIVGGTPGSPLLLRTVDAGATWNPVTSSAGNMLQGVFFPSPQVGYIVGWSGDILKTTNGGATWNLQTTASVYGNLDVFFTDNMTGYLVGGNQAFAGIQKTTNGGQTWVSQTAPINQGLIGVFFVTPNIGYAVGAQGTIIKTTNGGTVGVHDYTNNFSLNVYPNPCTNTLTISCDDHESAERRLSVYSVDGRLLRNEFFSGKETQLDVSDLSAGMYMLVIEDRDQRITRRFTKQ